MSASPFPIATQPTAAADLAAIIAHGEDSRHQFKRDFTHANSLAAELAAFANMGGGVLLVGVGDGGVVPGLTLADNGRLNQLLSNAASQHVKLEFDDDRQGNQFRVTFKRAEVQAGGVSGGVNGGVNQATIGPGDLINAIAQNPGLRAPALANLLGVTPKRVEHWIKQLRDGGKIEFVGTSKTGGYRCL